MTCSFCKTSGTALVVEDAQRAAGICRECLAELSVLARWDTRNPLRRRPAVEGDHEHSTMIAQHHWIAEAMMRDFTRYVRFLERARISPADRGRLACTFCGTQRSACAKLYTSLMDHVFICDRCTRDPRDRNDDEPIEVPAGSCSFCLELRPSYAIESTDARICGECLGFTLDIVGQELEEDSRVAKVPAVQDAPTAAAEQARARARADSPSYRCTFCGAHRADRRKLISALTKNVFICDRCAREARDPK